MAQKLVDKLVQIIITYFSDERGKDLAREDRESFSAIKNAKIDEKSNGKKGKETIKETEEIRKEREKT